MTAAAKDLKVAIIDTGVNEFHPHVGKIAGGISFLVKENQVVRAVESCDYLGHGTAVAGIIRAKAPQAELYSLQVFQRSLTTYPSLVAAAVYQAVELGCQVINLSLAVSDSDQAAVLKEACREAYSQGCLLVAAGKKKGEAAWPADWPMALKVYGDSSCSWDQVVINEKQELSLTAHPYPRPLPGRPQQHNLQGSSFACAHVSGLAAAILGGEKKDKDYQAFRKLLNKFICGSVVI